MIEMNIVSKQIESTNPFWHYTAITDTAIVCFQPRGMERNMEKLG